MSEIIYLKDILLAKAALRNEKKIATASVKTVRRSKIKSSLVERPKKEDAKQNGVS